VLFWSPAADDDGIPISKLNAGMDFKRNRSAVLESSRQTMMAKLYPSFTPAWTSNSAPNASLVAETASMCSLILSASSS
jgi:hypothetical protein